MRSIASVARRAAYLLVAATVLVVIVACPEGPVGETGGTGKTGETGPPGGVAPVAINTIAPVAVQAGSTTTAMDVAKYFNEPQDQALTYTVMSVDAKVATGSITGSMLTITGVAVGTTTVTVTATDTEGLNAKQSIAVTVTAQPPAQTPYSACEKAPLNTSDAKTCKVTLTETQLLRSTNPAKVTVGHDGASRTVWVVTAVDRTGDAGVEIKVLEVVDEGARHDDIGMFTVVVANSLPSRTKTLPPAEGKRLITHDYDAVQTSLNYKDQQPATYYYEDEAGLASYFEDKDASDKGKLVFNKNNIVVSDPAKIIVRHVDSDGSTIYFDVVEEDSHTENQNFTITVHAEDGAKAVSTASVELQYEWPAPRTWTYAVEQNADGGFQTRPVGLRKGVAHTLTFSKHEPGVATPPPPADTNLLRLLDDVVTISTAVQAEVDGASQAGSVSLTAFTGANFALPTGTPSVGAMYLSITGSGVVTEVGDMVPATAGDAGSATGTVTFKVDRMGTGTITLVVKAYYEKKGAVTGTNDWHEIGSTKRTLHLNVMHVGAGTNTY